MTESQYIDATNLAKLRIALSIMRDVVPNGPAEDLHFGAIVRDLDFQVLKLWQKLNPQ